MRKQAMNADIRTLVMIVSIAGLILFGLAIPWWLADLFVLAMLILALIHARDLAVTAKAKWARDLNAFVVGSAYVAIVLWAGLYLATWAHVLIMGW